MAIMIHIYYSGEGTAARDFAREMLKSGTVDKIRSEEGNLAYEYFFPFEDEHTVLLTDKWRDQAALDAHHASAMMQTIMQLRIKYKLGMRVERYISDGGGIPDSDKKFIV